ncbi:MAG TPA: HEAT repeat domain-containing protein [Vicinamibacterales bacterium]|nr:HEAT repeat domain-containing protein [Vicinamibacterales bacterium]
MQLSHSRHIVPLVLAVVAAGCASAPPSAPITVPFDTKMSWIIRLEDQRILRDAVAPVLPPPAPTGRRAVRPPAPPPPPDLIRLSTDEEARIRRRAAIAIGRVGLADGVPALVRLLQADTDAEVRQMAAFALGLIGDQSAVEPLRVAVGDPSPLVAGRAAEALGLIGDVASAPIIGKLVASHAGAAAAIAPDESRPQQTASADAFRLGVYALTRLKAYEPLAAAVLGPDGQPTVQWWPVAYAFQRMEDRRALPVLLSLARSDGAYTRAFAVKGLGALKDPTAVPVLLPLIDAAHATSGPTIEAIRAMGRIGDASGEPLLTKLLYTRGLHPMVRAETLLALGESAAPVSVDAFIDFLGDPLPIVRLAALQGFSKREDDTFLTVLSGLDADPHWSVRAGLATVLATKDPERALPRLTPLLADADARVIPAVLTALTKLKAPGIDKILLERLGSEDVGIRTAAAANIGELKPEGGVDALIAAYKRGEVDVVFDVRAAAIEALSKYGGAVAVQAIRDALVDKDWPVRVKAAELLKAIDPTIETAQTIRPAPASRPLKYDSPALLNPTVSPHIYVETDKGTIEIELDVLDAPLTSDNVMVLARKGYFDGLTFHRVVPNFVVQGGDPRGDGEGGPGYSVRDELNQEPYLRGTVGMALAWRDTGGSQFFIALGPQPHLDARYTVFGRVVGGMEVADAIVQGDVMKRVRVWDGEKENESKK